MLHKTTQPQSASEYLRLTDVRKRYRVSGSTIWRWSSSSKTGFPKPISLSPGVTVWPLAALLAFEATQAAKTRGAK